MTNIDSYNASINSLNNQIKRESNPTKKAELESEKNSKISLKNTEKRDTIIFINTTFDRLKWDIDDMPKPLNLFSKIKNMYINAINYEDSRQVFNVCNNSEIQWAGNSTFIQNWVIYFDWNKTMKRYSVLSEDMNSKLSISLSRFSDDKISQVINKVDEMIDIFASRWDDKSVNTLMDIKDLLRESYLYE